MERWSGRVALVTGASIGIGAAICRQLVQHGMIVVGCARNVEKIQQIEKELIESKAKGKLHAIKCDVTKEDEIEAMFEWIKSNLGGVDVCINNAGLGDTASLLGPATTAESLRNMVDVNVVALCICTKLAVNSMKERGVDDGQIIHLNSMSGHRVPISPTNHFYCATKYAVRAITEGHRQELRELKSNIRVAAISPGYVETDFLVNASFTAEQSRSVFTSMKAIQPSEVADSVIYIMSAPQHVQIHDILMRPTEQVY